MHLVKTWLVGARLRTLTVSIIPCLVGSFMASHVDWRVIFFGVICVALIHLGTNLLNEGLDYKKEANIEMKIADVRDSKEGVLSFFDVLLSGLICLFLAAVFGIPIIVEGGSVYFWLIILSCVVAYLYTGGPFPIAYIGLGEIFVLVFFGWMATLGAFYLQEKHLTFPSFLAASQLGLLGCSILAINNLRDLALDKKVHKKTLAVRFGSLFARIEISCLLLLPFVLNFFWFREKDWMFFLSTFLLFPLALKQYGDF